MRECYYLVVSREDNFMLADYSTTANGVDTDLGGGALTSDLMTVVNVFRFLPCRADCIGYHDSRSAGSVKLLIVMLFYYFHVKVHSEGGGSRLAKLDEKIYTYGHIPREKYGGVL